MVQYWDRRKSGFLIGRRQQLCHAGAQVRPLVCLNHVGYPVQLGQIKHRRRQILEVKFHLDFRCQTLPFQRQGHCGRIYFCNLGEVNSGRACNQMFAKRTGKHGDSIHGQGAADPQDIAFTPDHDFALVSS